MGCVWWDIPEFHSRQHAVLFGEIPATNPWELWKLSKARVTKPPFQSHIISQISYQSWRSNILNSMQNRPTQPWGIPIRARKLTIVACYMTMLEPHRAKDGLVRPQDALGPNVTEHRVPDFQVVDLLPRRTFEEVLLACFFFPGPHHPLKMSSGSFSICRALTMIWSGASQYSHSFWSFCPPWP